MRSWGNLVGYQVVWFVAVATAAQGRPWPAVAAALAFLLWQWRRPPAGHAADLALAGTSLALGVALDGGLAASGWLHYAAPRPGLLAPAWILAIWLAFSTTPTRSLAFLRGRPLAAAVFGAIGGPLAYLGAARGFDAVAFAAPAWKALATLSAAWAVALGLLAVVAGRFPLPRGESPSLQETSP